MYAHRTDYMWMSSPSADDLCEFAYIWLRIFKWFQFRVDFIHIHMTFNLVFSSPYGFNADKLYMAWFWLCFCFISIPALTSYAYTNMWSWNAFDDAYKISIQFIYMHHFWVIHHSGHFIYISIITHLFGSFYICITFAYFTYSVFIQLCKTAQEFLEQPLSCMDALLFESLFPISFTYIQACQ